MKIVLASKSPRRQNLLRKAGVNFNSVDPLVKEIESGIFHPHIPIINAIAKAEEVAKCMPEALVIGADTVIEFKNRSIGKPLSLQHATTILQQLSGKTHLVVSGVCLICRETKLETVFADTTQVRFKKLSAAVIAKYLKNVNVLDKAGAYAIQEYGNMLIEQVDGSINNVTGLPLERIMEFLSCFQQINSVNDNKSGKHIQEE